MIRNRLWLRVFQAVAGGGALGLLLQASLPPLCYTWDLQVDYLAGAALRDGVDPLMPLNDLMVRYFDQPMGNYPHSNPHPPWIGLVFLPFTPVPFPFIVPLWLLFNLWLLLVIGRWLGLSFLGSLALAAWPPLYCVLRSGNYELVILACLMLGWRAAGNGRDWRAGCWLGLAIAIKLYPALFLAPFLLRRRWALLLTAAGVLALSQAGTIKAVGLSGTMRYYLEVLPAVSQYYTPFGLNSSVYAAMLRLFGGAKDVAPLIDAGWLVLPAAGMVSACALASFFRLGPQAGPVAAFVALPAVWYTYPVLVLPQLMLLARSGRFQWSVRLAAAGTCFVLPAVYLLSVAAGRYAPPMAVLLAVQPMSLVALLALSLATRHLEGGQFQDRDPDQTRR